MRIFTSISNLLAGLRGVVVAFLICAPQRRVHLRLTAITITTARSTRPTMSYGARRSRNRLRRPVAAPTAMRMALLIRAITISGDYTSETTFLAQAHLAARSYPSRRQFYYSSRFSRFFCIGNEKPISLQESL